MWDLRRSTHSSKYLNMMGSNTDSDQLYAHFLLRKTSCNVSRARAGLSKSINSVNHTHWYDTRITSNQWFHRRNEPIFNTRRKLKLWTRAEIQWTEACKLMGRLVNTKGIYYVTKLKGHLNSQACNVVGIPNDKETYHWPAWGHFPASDRISPCCMRYSFNKRNASARAQWINRIYKRFLRNLTFSSPHTARPLSIVYSVIICLCRPGHYHRHIITL